MGFAQVRPLDPWREEISNVRFEIQGTGVWKWIEERTIAEKQSDEHRVP